MTYHFKPVQELMWATVLSVGLVLGNALLTFDPDKILDWRVWAFAVGAACVRALGGALLDYLSGTTQQLNEIAKSKVRCATCGQYQPKAA